MNILVVGSGAREHTLVWKLAQSEKADKIYAVPGNPGMAELAECIEGVSITDNAALVKLAQEWKAGLFAMWRTRMFSGFWVIVRFIRRKADGCARRQRSWTSRWRSISWGSGIIATIREKIFGKSRESTAAKQFLVLIPTRRRMPMTEPLWKQPWES